MRTMSEPTCYKMKMQPRYRAPFFITKVLSIDIYKVSALKGTRERHYVATARISSLKIYFTRVQAEDDEDATGNKEVCVVSMAKC